MDQPLKTLGKSGRARRISRLDNATGVLAALRGGTADGHFEGGQGHNRDGGSGEADADDRIATGDTEMKPTEQRVRNAEQKAEPKTATRSCRCWSKTASRDRPCRRPIIAAGR
jgi:hypothetical protein